MSVLFMRFVRRLSGWLPTIKTKTHSDSRGEGFAGYEVKTHVGTSDRLVVAFSGVGNVRSGEVQFEWGNSLMNACDGDHIIFVKDNLRSWYTKTEGRESVVTLITDYIHQKGIKKTLAFGLSMGGYGALVFSSLITFDYVIALSSRACVGKRSGFDSRNKALMRAIPENIFSQITRELINPDTRYVFLASRDQCNDLKHLALLFKECPEAAYYLSRGDHNIGHEMNLQGTMKPFLQWLTSGCEDNPLPSIEPAEASLMHLGEYLVEHRLHTLSTEMLSERHSDLVLNSAPLFLLDTHVQLMLERGTAINAFPCPLHGSVSSQFLRHYLGMGWYTSDEGGAWSQGLWHQLTGQLATDDIVNKQFQLRLHIELFFPDESPAPVRVALFQNKQLTKSFEIGRERNKRFLAAPLQTDDEGYFDVFIHTPFASMPAQQRKSEDSREIAIYLKSFVITSA